MSDTEEDVAEARALLGLTAREYVALAGGVGTLGGLCCGYAGARTSKPAVFDNEYFLNLADESWARWTAPTAPMKAQYKAAGKELYMLQTDMLLRWDPSLLSIGQEYAADESLFFADFADAWAKLMNADRFNGPTAKVC